jgi:hypothetical protein
MEPFLTFFLGDGLLFALMSFAAIFYRALPDLMVNDAQRHFLRRHQQRGMIEEPLMSLIAQHAKPLGGRMMGEIKLRRVLHSQNRGVFFRTVISGLVMWFLNTVLIDFIIIEKAIGCFRFIPSSAGLRNGGLWIVRQLLSNLDKALSQTRITKVSAAEFMVPPSCALIPRQRWYDSY